MDTKKFSRIQETTIAKYLGWKVVSGSGARDCHPGDVKSDEWLGECKTHTQAGINIKFVYTVWKKICAEAESQFKVPVLFVDDGSQRLDKTWCLFPYKLRLSQCNCMIVPLQDYILRSRTNICFGTEYAHKVYDDIQRTCDEPVVFVTSFAKDYQNILAVVPIATFKQLFSRED